MTASTSTRVEAIGLSRTFRRPSTQVHALRDVSLHVDAGEVVSVEGPSGSGKSTLLHVLAGLEPPDQGRVVINGHNLAGMNETHRTSFRRRHIGLVLQAPDLLPTLDALDNVAVPAILDGTKVPQARRRARALLEQVGLTDRGDHRPNELSGGEQQRVCIARALMNNATVILADEPTATLDTVTSDEILHLLAQVASDGRAVLVATHDPRAAAQAHRTLRLVDGTVVWPERDLRSIPSG